ncbi:LPD7 domain-containing protein [Brevundimonas naejangsanensis]|nr:LPD7 domain-containing protein [Brevundimonas naejangsanensis]
MASDGNTAPADPMSGNGIRPTPGRAPARAPVSRRKGDLPEGLEARYLVEHDRKGRAERFHRDNRSREALFRDHGGRLTASEAYPDAIRDMLRIAAHRGWREIVVSGDTAFRREVWVQARTLDLRVRGYSPREIDRQAAERQIPPRASSRKKTEADRIRAEAHAPTRMNQIAIVVRNLVEDPAIQARLMRRAVARVIRHLDAGRRFDRDIAETRSRRQDRER